MVNLGRLREKMRLQVEGFLATFGTANATTTQRFSIRSRSRLRFQLLRRLHLSKSCFVLIPVILVPLVSLVPLPFLLPARSEPCSYNDGLYSNWVKLICTFHVVLVEVVHLPHLLLFVAS